MAISMSQCEAKLVKCKLTMKTIVISIGIDSVGTNE